MNERIRVFAEQATDKWVGGEFFDREKFAELIVRDCALTAGLMEHNGRKGIGAVILDNYGINDDHHALDIMVAENQRLGFYDD